MAAPVITMRRATAPYSQLSTLDFGNVPKNSTSSTQSVRFYNNFNGSSAVSDAEDCVLTVRSADGSLGNGGVERSPGYGDQIYLENWVEVKNISDGVADSAPLSEMIDETIGDPAGLCDGANTAFPITYGSTSSGTQVPDNVSSEGDTNPCIIVRKTSTDSTADNASKTAASWTFQLDSPTLSPIVNVTALVSGGLSYDVTGATFYEDSVTLVGGIQTNPEPTTGAQATISYAYNVELTYTTHFTYANGASYGTVTFVTPPGASDEVECDYLFRSNDSSFVTIPDDTSTTALTEDGHEIGGRVGRGDISDNDQDKDAVTGAITAGDTDFKNVIKDAYAFYDSGVPWPAPCQIRLNVPSDGQAGSESFILRLTYTYI